MDLKIITTFQVLFFLTKQRIKRNLFQIPTYLNILLIILLLIFIVANCYLLGKIIDKISSYKDTIINAICIYVYLDTIRRHIFPNYVRVSSIIHPSYPISAIRSYIYSIVVDAVTLKNLFTVIFLSLLTINSDQLTVRSFNYFLFAMIFSLHFNWALRKLFETKLSLITVLYVFSSFLIMIIFFKVKSIFVLYILAIILFAISFLSFKTPDYKFMRKNKLLPTYKISKWYSYFISIDNNLKATIYIQMMVKSIFLIAILIGIGKFILGYKFFFYLFALPITISTYYFNNIYIFSINKYRNIYISPQYSKHLFNYFSRLYLYILVIDYLISFTIIIWARIYDFTKFIDLTSESLLYFTLCYFTCAFILFPLSMWFSAKMPKKIDTALKKGSNTSFISTAIFLLIGILFSVLLINHFYVIIVSLTFVSITLISLIFKRLFKKIEAAALLPLVT